MKILLSERDHEFGNELQSILTQWGHEIIRKEAASSILTTLQKTNDIQMLILTEGDYQIDRLIKKIREFPQFVYVLCLEEADRKTSLNKNLLGVDHIWKKPVDIEAFRLHLFSVGQIVDFSMLGNLSHRLASANSNRQVINHVKLLNACNNDRKQAEQRLQEFHKQLKKIKLSSEYINGSSVEQLLETTENLGCEQLSDWLVGLLFLKSNGLFFRFLGFNLLQHLLKDLTRNLETGIKSLQEFGFFSESAETESFNVLAGKKVLLVEDMKYNRVLLKKILQKQKCVIVEAINGQDAVDTWKSRSDFDIIIMDMNMPVMDGFAATKEIRKIEAEESRKRIPIIALTALAMRGDKELCLEAGTDDYLPKPVEALSLIKTCKRLLVDDLHEKVRIHEDIPELNIKRVLLRSNNQTVIYAMESVFCDLGIEYDVLEKTDGLLSSIVEEDYNLIVLDSETDLELAYFIKNNFPQKHTALISHSNDMRELASKNIANNFTFPLQKSQVYSVLKYYSDKHQQAKKDAERMADVDSLAKIKGQAGIEEAISKSEDQLAVWQKAFRKIGGDLVLSHQFNMHGKFGFILGDVAGHDIQSGYTASWFSGLVEGTWGQNSNPFKFLINLNNLFAHDAEEENKRFVCALVLLWDPIREKLYYANAGIPGGIVIKKDTGKASFMEWTGVPIGMFPDMDMYDHGELDFTEGDRLIVATDGVLEAIPREIISNLSEAKSDKSAKYTLDAIVDFVTRSIEISDDLTIAVFEGKIPSLPKLGYRQTIRSDFKDVDQAVMKMESFIQEHANQDFDWPMISVAIREALINAVEHGNKNIVKQTVDIDLELGNGLLELVVSDCGSGFDLSTEKKRLAKEGDLRIHGRGIEMMENIGKSVSFLGGGIKLVFESKSEA